MPIPDVSTTPIYEGELPDVDSMSKVTDVRVITATGSGSEKVPIGEFKLPSGQIPYNPSVSGLEATNTKEAIDELTAEVNTKEDAVNKKAVINDSDTEFPTSKAVKAALNLKLDKANVYNGLDKTEEGFAGDARQLKVLNDKIAQLAGDVEQLAYVKIKNKAVNGNFENGLIAPFRRDDGGGGASTLAINSSTPISGNYDIRLTIITPSTAFNRPIFHGLSRAGNIGDKIYFHFYAKILSGTPTIWGIRDGTSTDSGYGGGVINGRNTRIIDVGGTGKELGVIYFRSQSVWDMQMDNFMRINLTETFGAGNEPTEEEMNLLISTLGTDYFEGEITIPAQKIMQWQLKLIRKNKNAIIASGGTII